MMGQNIKHLATGAVCSLALTALALGPGSASNASAQSLPAAQTQSFAVEGPGVLTCAQFTEARADKRGAEYQRFIGFAEGYLSAANLYEPNTFDLSPWHNAAAFDLIIASHCADHTEEIFANVLQRMVISFRPIRIAEYSRMLEVGNGENRAYVYETVMRRAQAALKQRGLYDGPEDGRFSPEMMNAIDTFQQSEGLTKTRVPDPATLWTLLNP